MTESLLTFYLQDIFAYILVMARFGGFFMFAPIFSEGRINPSLRLLLSLFFALVITPAVTPYLPDKLPQHPGFFNLLIVGEILIGLFAGLIGRLLITALDVAGSLIGFQMSLANAFTNSPATAQQTSLPGAFLTLSAVMLIFATGFHLVMISMIIKSYALFQPGSFAPLTQLSSDLIQTFTKFLSAAFLLGLQVAAPVMILGLTMFAAAGIVNRLMPQIQVFFILQPFQIMLGFITLTLSLVIVMGYYIRDFMNKYPAMWNMG